SRGGGEKKTPPPGGGGGVPAPAATSVQGKVDVAEVLQRHRWLRGLGPPADGGTAVGVERVVRGKLLGHVVVVVPGDRLKSRGERVEARRLRCQPARVGIGAADDLRERLERRIGQLGLVEQSIERTMS